MDTRHRTASASEAQKQLRTALRAALDRATSRFNATQEEIITQRMRVSRNTFLGALSNRKHFGVGIGPVMELCELADLPHPQRFEIVDLFLRMSKYRGPSAVAQVLLGMVLSGKKDAKRDAKVWEAIKQAVDDVDIEMAEEKAKELDAKAVELRKRGKKPS